MLKVCCGVTNEREKDGVYKRPGRTLVRRAESDRNSAMSYVFKHVLEVRTWWFYGCGLVNLVDLMNLKGALLVGGSASPFIDKGDGFTSERVRVRMLLSFVAHASGYKIMVGTHNTVDVTIEC